MLKAFLKNPRRKVQSILQKTLKPQNKANIYPKKDMWHLLIGHLFQNYIINSQNIWKITSSRYG